jgi:EmrB/QacA subfamily drug resistance transporter
MSITHRGRQIITLIVSCLGMFMVLLDASIVVLALPTIQTQLHVNLSDLQWTVDAYTLPFAALLLTAGTLNDRFGRKRLFLIGLVLFLIGSALCGFAPTLSWLIFGRVLQGMGGAALSPGSLSLLATAFPEPRSRSQVIGIWSGVSGLALAAGPLIGGLLIQVAGWPAIFFVNLPVGIITLALSLPGLAESRNPDAQRIDLPGQLLVTGGLTCLIMALIESSSLGWTSPVILGLFGGTVVLLAAFLLVEARAREPLLPPSLFRNKLFSAANLANVVINFAVLGVVFFLAQYFQAVQGSTALVAGLQTLPLTVGTFLAAPLAGQITAWTSPRLPTVLGALIASGALFLLTNLSPVSSFASIWWKLALMGIGVGLTFSPLTVAVLAATPQARAGLASSLVSTGRQIGATLGVAVLGSFVLQQFAGNIASQLAQRGVPGPAGATIASKIAGAGAQASKIPVSGHLPLSTVALHQAIGQAFVDALRGSFLISAIGLLTIALLVFFLFPSKQRAVQGGAKSTDATVPTVVQDMQPVTAAVDTEKH